LIEGSEFEEVGEEKKVLKGTGRTRMGIV